MILKRCSSSLVRGHVAGGLFLRLSTTTTTTNDTNPSKPRSDVEDYLVKSSGFSLQEVSKTLKSIQNRRKSIRSPEPLMVMMRNHGFSDTQIKKIIISNPDFLHYDPDKNLAPKFASLLEMGFSPSDLVQLVQSDTRFLNLNFHRTILPRLQFWQGLLLGSSGDEGRRSGHHLAKMTKHKFKFLCGSIESAKENLSLLGAYFGCGVSNERIAMVLQQASWLILQKKETLIADINYAEKELGIPRSSGMFLQALLSLKRVSKAKFEVQRELMRSFGWSDADFLDAFHKAPAFVGISTKVLSEKMTFLVKEAGCTLSEVAYCPILLTYSLQRRVIPRFRVINILKSMGLLPGDYKFTRSMHIRDEVFTKRYVVPHKEQVPELEEIFGTSIQF